MRNFNSPLALLSEDERRNVRWRWLRACFDVASGQVSYLLEPRELIRVARGIEGLRLDTPEDADRAVAELQLFWAQKGALVFERSESRYAAIVEPQTCRFHADGLEMAEYYAQNLRAAAAGTPVGGV